MEKIYRVKLNSKGMPNFATAEEVADRPQDDCSTCEHYNDVGDWCKTCGVSHYTPRMKGADNE